MALGGNPIFNGKNFRGATQAPPVPQAYGHNNYGQNQFGQQGYAQPGYGQPGYGQQNMSNDQLQQMYNRPAAGPAETGRMTFDDVIVKTAICLGAVVVGAAVTLSVALGLASMLMIVGALGGFVLALVNTFKKQPSPALILAYAALEGLFLGGLTRVLDTMYPGVGPAGRGRHAVGVCRDAAAVQERQGPGHAQGDEVLYDRHRRVRAVLRGEHGHDADRANN
jgi:hypothetical protein